MCISASEKEENQKRDQDFGEPQNWDECDCVGSNCEGSSGKSSNNSPLTVGVLNTAEFALCHSTALRFTWSWTLHISADISARSL